MDTARALCRQHSVLPGGGEWVSQSSSRVDRRLRVFHVKGDQKTELPVTETPGKNAGLGFGLHLLSHLSRLSGVSQCQDLYAAGEKITGTDEMKFITILCTRSAPHLMRGTEGGIAGEQGMP